MSLNKKRLNIYVASEIKFIEAYCLMSVDGDTFNAFNILRVLDN